MCKLSAVIVTRNESENIKNCILSLGGIANEIIVYDESSVDNTREIAKKLGARVFKVRHNKNFHKTKRRALSKATCKWILQLDADERLSNELRSEIVEVINLNDTDIRRRAFPDDRKKLFLRHQKILGYQENDDKDVAAFFIPRRNYFLGKPLRFGGAYPDGVIRLVKRGKARFPAKHVHEQIDIDGGVSWLFNDLEHFDSPTLRRYLSRLNRYTDLHADKLKERKVPRNLFYLFYYAFFKAFLVFLSLYIRHKGVKDGIRGFLWCFFSASHYTISYFKYWNMN